ncbi:MAG: hypothetical protein JRI46_11100 [Deltaproteobacteria bacterium]|nr:hypothetical protein [Deltaproteobacteria bacterium]
MRNRCIWIFALFFISAGFPSLNVVFAAEETLVLQRPFPSEFDPQAGESVLVQYYLSQDATTLTIQAKDFKGAVIRQEVWEDVRAGPGQWQWDGRDDRRQLVQQGQYQIFFILELPDGRTVSDSILVRVIKRAARPLAPPPLPPPVRPYRIDGEISGFFRRDTDEDEDTYEGRFRLHGIYDQKPFMADLNLYLIQREREQTNWDNCYASFAYEKKNVKFLSVFRKSLGSFIGPFRLFDDIRTERFKSGARLDVDTGIVTVTGLGFVSEGDTLSEEKGYAARMEIPLSGIISIGSSFVGRYYKLSGFDDEVRNIVGGVDGVLNLGRGFSMAAEYAMSDDEETDEWDVAGRMEARYEGPRMRAVLGYQDLGEDFEADLAYVSRDVRSDARGVDCVVDYYPGRILFMERAGVIFRSFYYQRRSNYDDLYEVDGNIRFGIGPKHDFMLGVIDHEDDASDYTSVRARHLHRFTDIWSNELSYSVNIADGDTTHTVREMVHYTKPPRRTISAGLQWINRHASGSDPSCWDELSLLAWGQWRGWFFELENRFVFSDEIDSNLFAKVGYQFEFFRRYVATLYVAFGDRASQETSNTIEVGMGVNF